MDITQLITSKSAKNYTYNVWPSRWTERLFFIVVLKKQLFFCFYDREFLNSCFVSLINFNVAKFSLRKLKFYIKNISLIK